MQNLFKIKNTVVPHIPPQATGYLHAGVEAWSRSSTKVRMYHRLSDFKYD